MFAHIFKANPYHDENGKFTSQAKARTVNADNLKPTAKVVAAIKKRLTKAEIAKIEGYEKSMAGKKTTAELYRDKNGHWSAERSAKHKEIIDKFFADADQYIAPEGTTPRMVTLGGRGGSGKSKLTDGTVEAFDSSKYKTLDPDEIKKQLPGYDGTNAGLYHEESGHIADTILQKAFMKRMNVVQDVTMRSEQTVKESLDFAKAMGYDLEGHYMHLPREEAGYRAAKRGLKEKDPRYVPFDIVAGNTHNEQNFHRLKGYFKNWSMWSNDVKVGEKPKLLDKSKE